jgi:trehalose 6-phosphate synthase
MDEADLEYEPPPIIPRPLGGRLVIVSNRVPALSDAPAAGGLAIALESVLKAEGGLWFGWSGEASKDSEPEPRAWTKRGITFAVSDLSPRDIEEYYHGFANRALWPVCHYRLDLANLSDSNAAAYFRVNTQFACQLHKMLRRQDVVWIHDYHLIPIASYLRRLGCANRIGFFLHIPWPGPEVASALPAYEQILRAFGAYDVAGFQTETDANNFCACLEATKAGHRIDSHWCEIGGRRLQLRAFPISIDCGTLVKQAQVANKNPVVKRTLSSLDGRPFILGVDRLDYSKGLKHRLEAFALFLERAQWALRRRVAMLQITPRSRLQVPEYVELQRDLAEEAGRINGKFGDVDWTPLRYIHKTLSQSTLAGLYHNASVGLVTPLRDGMNLVAKEYVAAQSPDNPGVLVLSQFAGAAQELKSALLVNPYDITATAAAIAQALSMPIDERKERWGDMIAVLRANTVHDWADDFLKALDGVEEAAENVRPPLDGVAALAKAAARAGAYP